MVTQIIKDKNGDLNKFKNYTPVSSLPFLSKILERTMYYQPISHLERNYLFPHSNQPTDLSTRVKLLYSLLLKVFTDIESLKNEDKLIALISLDLSSTFNTVDDFFC